MCCTKPYLIGIERYGRGRSKFCSPGKGTHVLDRVVALTKSEDSTAKLRALSLLNESSHGEDSVVLSAIGATLSDRDRTVKEYAIGALAARSHPAALEYLIQASFDSDPNVRLTVLEIAAQYGRTALLQHALMDNDETVRVLADFLLKQRNQ
jgi:HEAT repeat protein